MNNSLLQENKAKLEEEQKRLRTVLGHGATHDGPGEFPGEFKPKFTEAGSEEGENASEVEQFANDLSVTVGLEQRLQKVEAALNRIESGAYGKCMVGGEEIEHNRLAAEPAAETCIEHAKS